MLTDPAIQQIIHLVKRLAHKDKTVLNHSTLYDRKFTRNTIEKIKSHAPFTQVPINFGSWLEQSEIQTTNKRKGNTKYDAVVPGNYLESTTQFFQRLEQIHNETKQDGFIVIDLPFSVNAGWFAYQPNLFKQLAEQNDYEITYFKAMDHSGLYPVVIDASKTLTNTFITESLYKYGNTVNMRINVTFKKVNNNPFKFEDLK
jgi:hypothetical protein